jgi:HSP20 family molecular chaperone IbpA
VTHQPDNSREVPVKIYRSDEPLTVAALMPGVLAADVRVEVTPDRRLILSGKSRPVLKEDKDFLGRRVG